MSYLFRFPLLIVCFLSFTMVSCRSEINSASSSQSSSTENVPALSPEKQNQVDTLLTQGNQKIAAEDYQGAIADFSEALTIDQTNAEALSNRGLARSRLKNYEGALADYNQALSLNNQAPKVYYNRGLVQIQREQYEKAIADFTKAIEQKPDFASAIGNRGFAYAELENYPAAIDDLEKAAQLFKEQGKKRTAYRLQRTARYIQP
ncbi:Tetratricopeptide TPR_1 repeat-containing protein [Halothece sp. PCC 7418]|uniref:tetratricopeptide repeat protein n=1 Tax=Halothece sp. (strain PCC 7418) TaxID=65093 RepID=UPI0002A074D4|nr:tetratricopeptide repeat protein [Halothece sp. PCC 7418]AFZ43363.1 Tetratricopeptide TPR_1 repeat-containing protein [Halothece sp. PCC 7418]